MSILSGRPRLTLHQLVAGRGATPATDGFVPIRVMVVDLEVPLPSIKVGTSPAGQMYRAAEILLRQHGRPLGIMSVNLPAGTLSATQLRALIEQRWGDVVGQDDEPTDLFQPPSPPPVVSVVVPTCRRPDDIARCVDSILATGYPALEMIVVDNAPDDPATAALVAERYHDDPRVKYLQEWVPGASRARNRGIRAATGDIVAFTDDDILVDRYWVGALVQVFAAHPGVSCVTGLVLPAVLDMPAQLWFEQYGGFNRGYVQRLYNLQDHRGDTLLYPYTGGAFGGLGNAAFRRSALAHPDALDITLGPGTPAFGAEDQDVFLTLLRDGGTLLYEPAALVQHRHRESYADLRWQVFTYGAGYVAGLVSSAVKDRAVAIELLRYVPTVLRYLAGHRAPQQASERPDYVCRQQLRQLERAGQLYGPIAYLRAVAQRKRRDSEASLAEAASLAAVE